MSLDGFLRQQLGVDVVASAPFEGRVSESDKSLKGTLSLQEY
jgi:hypothetical protein